MNLRPFAFVCLWASLGLTSCTKQQAPAAPHFLAQHVGKTCSVQFRRDALGAGGSLPVSPTTDSINGASVTQEGKLLAVEAEGIVLEDSSPAKAVFWIPYHAILSVRVYGKR